MNQLTQTSSKVIGKTILVVDNENKILDVLSMIIQKFGHSVIIAKNGIQAVKLYRQTTPDLVLMDVRMPRMDGCSAYSEIKEFDKEANVVFITAFKDDECISDLCSNEPIDILAKPFHYSELKELIHHKLDEKRQNLEK